MNIITRSPAGLPWKALRCDVCGAQSNPVPTTEEEADTDRGRPDGWGTYFGEDRRTRRDSCPECKAKREEESNVAARAAERVVPEPYNEKTDLACRATRAVLGPTYTRESGRFELFRKAYDRLNIDVLYATVNALERGR